jgi:hypothetical protein
MRRGFSREFCKKYPIKVMIPSKEECCVECQELNPFFRLSGGVIGKFAYTRETPFIQPFESIESPWADFIKADSMETNIKKLLKLAQKYRKETAEEKKKAEEEAKEEEEKKPKPKEKTARRERPEPRAKGKEKVIEIDDPKDKEREVPQGVLTRGQLERDKSRWKSINSSSGRLSRIGRQELLLMAARLNVLTKSGTNFQNVDRHLYKKLNKKFGISFPPKPSGIPLRR